MTGFSRFRWQRTPLRNTHHLQFPVCNSGNKNLAPAKALLRIPPGLYHQGAETIAGIKAVIPEVPDPPNPRTESGGTGTVSISQRSSVQYDPGWRIHKQGVTPGLLQTPPRQALLFAITVRAALQFVQNQQLGTGHKVILR